MTAFVKAHFHTLDLTRLINIWLPKCHGQHCATCTFAWFSRWATQALATLLLVALKKPKFGTLVTIICWVHFWLLARLNIANYKVIPNRSIYGYQIVLTHEPQCAGCTFAWFSRWATLALAASLPYINSLKLLKYATNQDCLLLATLRYE